MNELYQNESGYDLQTRNDISWVLSSLSALGALYIFLIFFAFKKIRRKVLYQLVFNISLADLIGIIAGTYVPASYQDGEATNNEQEFCDITAVFVSYGNLSSLFWSVSFGYKIYQLIIKEKSPHDLNKLKWSYFCCCGIPAILCIIVVVSSAIGKWDLLGYNVTYCWLVSTENITGTRYLALLTSYSILYYIPLAISVIANIALYLKIFSILRKLKLQFKWPLLFLLYPFLLLVCCLPAIIDRTFIILDPDSTTTTILHYVHVGLMQIHGFLNAIVYGINPEVKEEVKKLFSKCRTRKKRNLNALLQSLKETNDDTDQNTDEQAGNHDDFTQ